MHRFQIQPTLMFPNCLFITPLTSQQNNGAIIIQNPNCQDKKACRFHQPKPQPQNAHMRLRLHSQTSLPRKIRRYDRCSYTQEFYESFRRTSDGTILHAQAQPNQTNDKDFGLGLMQWPSGNCFSVGGLLFLPTSLGKVSI